MNNETENAIEAAVFRRLLKHLDEQCLTANGRKSTSYRPPQNRWPLSKRAIPSDVGRYTGEATKKPR